MEPSNTLNRKRTSPFRYGFGMLGTSIPINMLKSYAAAYYVLKLGLITINEARQKRGMEYYDAAEMGEFVDKPIIYNGGSALPVLDVGQNPEPAVADEPPANEEKPDTNKAFKLVQELAQRYLYGRSQP